VFVGDNNATVHYLSGTTGWGTKFGGRPTSVERDPNYSYTAHNGSIVITKYHGSGYAVTTPAILFGLPVIGIGNNAFENNSALTSVTISDSVATIGIAAFASCVNLQDITVPESVINVKGLAFAKCPRLQAAFFQGNAPSLGLWVFAGDNNATVLYLSGTTGWRSNFGGRPTAQGSL
jgi:hypothetical protein